MSLVSLVTYMHKCNEMSNCMRTTEVPRCNRICLLFHWRNQRDQDFCRPHRGSAPWGTAQHYSFPPLTSTAEFARGKMKAQERSVGTTNGSANIQNHTQWARERNCLLSSSMYCFMDFRRISPTHSPWSFPPLQAWLLSLAVVQDWVRYWP